MKAKLPKAQPGRIIRNAVKKVVKTAPSSFKVSDAQIKKAITQTERQNFKDMFKKIDAQDAFKKKMGGSSTMKKYQAKNSQVDSSKVYYDKARKFQSDLDTYRKKNNYDESSQMYRGQGDYFKRTKGDEALQDSAKKYFNKMMVVDEKNRKAGKRHWAMPDTTKKMGGMTKSKKKK